MDTTDLDVNKTCFMCKSSLEQNKTVEVKRGLPNLMNAARERNDGNIRFLEGVETIKVHADCRRNYICKRMIQKYKNQMNSSQQ